MLKKVLDNKSVNTSLAEMIERTSIFEDVEKIVENIECELIKKIKEQKI